MQKQYTESSDTESTFWTPHFSVLDSTFFVLDFTFWLDSTLKIDPALVHTNLFILSHFWTNNANFDNCCQCYIATCVKKIV